MLREAWRWIIYGDFQFWIKGCIVSLFLLLAGTYYLIQPFWETHKELHAKQLALSHILSAQQALLNTEILTPPQDNQSPPIDELGEAFGLAVKPYENEVYFAGNTDRILILLDFLLTNTYDIQEFHIEKSHYKTLLAISQ